MTDESTPAESSEMKHSAITSDDDSDMESTDSTIDSETASQTTDELETFEVADESADNEDGATEDENSETEADVTAASIEGEDDGDSTDEPEEPLNWEQMGVEEELRDLLDKNNFVTPTLIQQKSIPHALAGKDLIASAPTGSGKTASFVLPMVQKLRGRQGTLGLILCPTREIALQTQAVLEMFAHPLGLNSAPLIGGIQLRSDEKTLAAYPEILVGTPGRICDHLERGNLWLDYLEFVILDEADRMLDMGFSTQLNQIMDAVPKNRQTLFFSATIDETIDRLCKKILHEPARVTIGKPLAAAKSIEQSMIWTNPSSKLRVLKQLLKNNQGSTIIFTSTKDQAYKLWRDIDSGGHSDSTYISSDKMQNHREQALQRFKDGEVRILIATDVAGRGIHVDDVTHVVNFDMPPEAYDYIHRIGRTGRKEASGKATSIVTVDDVPIIHQVERMLGKNIPAMKTADFRAPSGRSRGYGRGGSSGRGRSSRGRSSGGGRGGRSGSGGGRGGRSRSGSGSGSGRGRRSGSSSRSRS